MAIQELSKFREKYPQYSDIDDSSLAQKLASKYPNSYSDLPKKVMDKQATKDFGAIRETPSLLKQVTTRASRAGSAFTQGLAGDIPFARKALTKQDREFEAYYPFEKMTKGATRLGRDIFLMKGINKIGLVRTALRGAGIGMLTADTEDPEEILKSAGKAAIALPVLKKSSEYLVPAIAKIAGRGLKASQQAWQDFIRAGFMVEKSTVERIQRKGIHSFFNKVVNPKIGISNRDDAAFLKLGEKIFNSAQKLRTNAGKVIGRWRKIAFRDERIRIDLSSISKEFDDTLKQVGLIDESGQVIPDFPIGAEPVGKRLLQIKSTLQKSLYKPNEVFKLLDEVNDLISASKSGAFSLGKKSGVAISKLRKSIADKMIRSADGKFQAGLRKSEKKFSKIADITDDVFDKLQLRKQGVALKDKTGATESYLRKLLKKETSAEEKTVFSNLEELLPTSDKFMELYKDIFAAQDLQREGVGMFLRRFILAPRMAAVGMETMQPIMKGIGKGIKTGSKAVELMLPPTIMRKIISDLGREE